MRRTQVIIVGAGPIGLELAAALKRLDVDYVQFDAGQIGQTVSWYPRQASFFSSPERIAIAGVPLVTVNQAKATREDYLAYLRSVVQQFDLEVNTFERVEQIEREGDHFFVRTRKHGEDRAYESRYVVLAIGDMHQPRLLHIPGEELDHVSHYFEDPHRYFRQRLLIVGGRNSAVEAALRCYHAGANVSISYRRSEFDEKSIKYWLLPEIKSLIRHQQIAFYPNTVPRRITPTQVELAPAVPNNQSGSSLRSEPAWGQTPVSPTMVDADFVLLLTGYVMDRSLFELAGVAMEGENLSPRHDPKTMETNVPGLFVAGTAAAGTQLHFRLFIENCHAHVARIVHAITGRHPPGGAVNQAAKHFGLPES